MCTHIFRIYSFRRNDLSLRELILNALYSAALLFYNISHLLNKKTFFIYVCVCVAG